MDLQLIKTFLEVAETGSFAAASDRLFVTQSAVSLRVQRLEEQLGRPVFLRSKGGVVLTPAGREFRGFATMILRNWNQARRRVSAIGEVPAELAIGAQPSLWPRFGFRWLDLLQAETPDLTVRADMARPEALTEMILSGAVQVMLSFAPVYRPELRVERLMEDQLVMVSPWPDASAQSMAGRYVMIDWGPEFMRFHDDALPHLSDTKLILGMGTLAAWYIRNRPFATYLPARYAHSLLEGGSFHLVKDAPTFAHTAWSIWREDTDPALRAVAERTLLSAVEMAEGDAAAVLDLF